MYRNPLLSLLQQYSPVDTHEQTMTQETIDFVRANPTCFDRSLLVGHITGSAWICSPNRQQVLLIHHRKLDRWLQPGGHADGDPDVVAVALREAQEETGLTSLKLLSNAIFDVDIHERPERMSPHTCITIFVFCSKQTRLSHSVILRKLEILNGFRWKTPNNR